MTLQVLARNGATLALEFLRSAVQVVLHRFFVITANWGAILREPLLLYCYAHRVLVAKQVPTRARYRLGHGKLLRDVVTVCIVDGLHEGIRNVLAIFVASGQIPEHAVVEVLCGRKPHRFAFHRRLFPILYGLRERHVHIGNRIGPLANSGEAPCNDYGEVDFLLTVRHHHCAVGLGEVESRFSRRKTLGYLRVILGEVEVRLFGISWKQVSFGRGCFHGIIQGIGLIIGSPRDFNRSAFVSSKRRNRGRFLTCSSAHLENRSGKQGAVLLVQNGNVQPMIEVLVGKHEAKAVCLFVRIDEELVALFRSRLAPTLNTHKAGIVKIDAFYLGILLTYTIRCAIVVCAPSFGARIEGHGAPRKLTIRVLLNLVPAASCRVLLLEDKNNPVLLLVGNGLVTSEALRNVNAFRLLIAANL